MREIKNHIVNPGDDGLRVQALDEPGDGGANHRYCIRYDLDPVRGGWVVPISFQDGPIKEVGVNGISHEALIAILIDRLKGFQEGEFACADNYGALIALETAMRCLHRRTKKRMVRGVKGTHDK